MKKLTLSLLFAYLFFTGCCQDAWKVVSLYSTSIAFNAIGESLNHSGNKEWGHAFNAASIGVMLTFPLVTKVDKKQWPVYPISYTFIRIGLFDPIYNAVQGYPISHIGTTSLWDKTLNNMNPPDGMLAMGRLMFLTVGFHVPFNYLDPQHKAARLAEKEMLKANDAQYYETIKRERNKRKRSK